ncbi:MAG: hypothetical protein ACYC96_12345 [Fimbriimonadaceae bacterium]
MKDDKKKLAIVGVLGFIIVGVGAFQFMGGSSNTPAKKPSATKSAAGADIKDANTVKNPEYAMALPERDPFKAPEDSGSADLTVKPPLPPAKRLPQPPHMRGEFGANTMLPNAGGGTIPPLFVAPTQPTFGFRLSGLISGRHPAAVFTDASGAQRLVPLHGSLDGDTQLVAVQKGRAVVSYRGKHLRLSLGGTPDAN